MTIDFSEFKPRFGIITQGFIYKTILDLIIALAESESPAIATMHLGALTLLAAILKISDEKKDKLQSAIEQIYEAKMGEFENEQQNERENG